MCPLSAEAFFSNKPRVNVWGSLCVTCEPVFVYLSDCRGAKHLTGWLSAPRSAGHGEGHNKDRTELGVLEADLRTCQN